jgi:hypothetical protein
MIFSFSPPTGKHFTGNALCSSDNCHATHSHFALFTINNAFLNHIEENNQRSHIWRMSGPGNRSLFSYPMIRKLPVQQGMNTREVRWCTSNCKTAPTGTRHKAVFSIIGQRNVTSQSRFFKKRKDQYLYFSSKYIMH